MTIARMPWPVDPIDKAQLCRMVLLARSLAPAWVPPRNFEYTYDEKYNLVDFQQPLSTLQRHTKTFFDSLPLALQLLHHATAISLAAEYATGGLVQLRKLVKADPSLKAFTPTLRKLEELLQELGGIRDPFVNYAVNTRLPTDDETATKAETSHE